MMKVLKQVVLVILMAMGTTNTCLAQEDLPRALIQKFKAYVKAVPGEDIFVQTDRSVYMAGEEIWFSLYLLDRQSLSLSTGSSIAYFELLNYENRPVIQKRIEIRKGLGQGNLTLSDTLSSGSYTLRVYTNWMKNFMPYNCFIKQIAVYNTLKSSVFKTPSKPVSEIKPQMNSHENGLIFNVNNDRPDSLVLNFITTATFRNSNLNKVCVFIQTRGNINFCDFIRLQDDSTTFVLPKSVLLAGINQLTVFNATGSPVAESYIFTAFKIQDRTSVSVTGMTDKRKKVVVQIETGEVIENAESIMSISVAPVNMNQNDRAFSDYMITGSEFGFFPEVPIQRMDSVLRNVSSNWTDWSKILSSSAGILKYGFEKEDQFLYGTLLDESQKPAPAGQMVIMCSIGRSAQFQYAVTGADGKFNFRIPVPGQKGDVIIMADQPFSYPGILNESPFYASDPCTAVSDFSQLPDDILKAGINYQVQTLYGNSSQNPAKPDTNSIYNPPGFYGKPDFELVMADYIMLPLIEEVFFELLPHVSLRKKDNAYEVIITDRIDNKPYIAEPCLMIDGVIIHDAGLIIGLDPEIVEKIDVIREKYLVGNYMFPGIVNIITKSADFTCVPFPPYAVRMPYRKPDAKSDFISPVYNSSESIGSRIPDYRNTMYWNPGIIINNNGSTHIEFWTSDIAGDYIISVQGISPDKVISLTKQVTIKDPPYEGYNRDQSL